MKRDKQIRINISTFIIFALVLLSQSVYAQNDGVEAPSESAFESLYQNPDRWTGSKFSTAKSLVERLYVNMGVEAGRQWNLYEAKDIDNKYGINTNLSIGCRLTPVHIIELGSSYGIGGQTLNIEGLNLSYLFDLSAYASRIEEPRRWQLFLRSGIEASSFKDISIAISGSMRLQYNISPSIGVYVEPKASMCVKDNNYLSKGDSFSSVLIGASFNIDKTVSAFRERQSRFKDSNYEVIPIFALKSNLLYNLLILPNIEIEVPIRAKWSVVADYTFPWWRFDDGTKESKRDKLQVLNANIEGRHYFGNREQRPALTGWFTGAYIGAGLFDVEHNGKGYQGESFITAGLSGGYAHIINKKGNLRMEYSLGVGCMNTEYSYYDSAFIDDEWHSLRDYYANYTWWGPTKLKVSLSWMWNRIVKKEM